MPIKVLAVGPNDIKDLIYDVGKEYPEIIINYVTYNSENEVIKIVKKHEQRIDILLFAGSLPYNIVKRNLNVNKPMVYIQFEGTALYRALFNLIKDLNYDFMEEKLNISIDDLQKFEVQECFEELGVFYHNLLFYEGDLEKDIDNIINFHYTLWVNNKIDLAITCVGSVYEKLKALDVPVSRIIPTRSSVRDGLQRVLLEGKSLRYLDSQIAIGIINLSHMYEGEHLSEYQLQRRILALQNILVDYGEESQSIIKWPDRKEVRFITTRGALQFKNGNSKELKLLKELFNKTQIKASLGIGIGRTANEAEIHAKEALEKASINKPSCFLVDNDGAVHGPIGNEVQLSYSIRVDNQKVLNIAKRANISGSMINRLLSFCEVHGKMTFTAAELADGFGITPRSARRILSKLEQVGLAVVTGEEQPINRGRPRQIYSILLNKKI